MKTIKKLAVLLTIAIVILFALEVVLSITTTNPPETTNKPPGNTKSTTPPQITEIQQTAVPTPEPKTIKLLFVGDTMLARSIGKQIQNSINPFEFVKEKFFSYDAVIANLETSVGNTGTPLSGKYYTFQAPPASADLLYQNNIKIVSLANNHTRDYGTDGLTQTLNLLNQAQVDYFGAGITPDEAFSPRVIQLSDVKLAFIGFNEIENRFTINRTGPTSAWYDKIKLQQSINSAKTQADLVFIMPHTGNEYQTIQNSWQKSLFHSLIDLGADMVIANHPHVIQGSEIYKNKKIYYALGNFVFDGMKNIPHATDGLCLEVIIKDKQISQVNELKIKIGPDGRPQFIN